MGNGHSDPEQPMEPMPQYPDMNVIFKGIPKMMQVAEDMHRMTNYIMDLRNMTFGLTIISVIGMLLFLLLKYVQGKQMRRRRRRFQNIDSEQSSLSRTMGVNSGDPYHAMNASRHYAQKQHPHHIEWNSRHVPIDMEKLIDSQHSNSTSALLVNNTGTLGHRHSPPQNHRQRVSPFVSSSVNGGSAGSGGTATTVTLHDYRNDVNENDQLNATIQISNHNTSMQLPTFGTSTPTTTAAPTLPFVITNSQATDSNNSAHNTNNHFQPNNGTLIKVSTTSPTKD